MAAYGGIRGTSRISVYRDNLRLNPKPSQRIRNHSPTGFEWGFNGSGPAQLALAILLLETDQATALRFYQHFKAEVIARLPKLAWHLTSQEVAGWLAVKLGMHRAVPPEPIDEIPEIVDSGDGNEEAAG
jgi:hypothetical protein